jgi:DNA-directed RNA polymerase specialized sigma24 family protein
MDEPMQYLLDLISHEDTYPSESLTLYVDKFSCVVHREKLYEALLSLPEGQRLVLILGFWHQWTDEEISRYMEVTPRTVYNLRQRAFNIIRNFYEQKGTDT